MGFFVPGNVLHIVWFNLIVVSNVKFFRTTCCKVPDNFLGGAGFINPTVLIHPKNHCTRKPVSFFRA